MTSRDFCFWLQGFFELADSSSQGRVRALEPTQADCIRRHLALVFKHEIDPSFPDSAELNKIHNPTPAPAGPAQNQVSITSMSPPGTKVICALDADYRC